MPEYASTYELGYAAGYYATPAQSADDDYLDGFCDGLHDSQDWHSPDESAVSAEAFDWSDLF